MTKRSKYSLLILFILALIYVLADKFYLSQRDILYPNFGITIPAGYATHGIDVSRYQKNINWKLVEAMSDRGHKISFAIIKSTEGTALQDPKFKRNWEEIQETALLRGAYLYMHPNRDGKCQANFFSEHTNLKTGDLPPVVDIEETKGAGKQRIKSNLKACLDALEEKYQTKPIIYTSVDFYDHYLGPEFDEYPLWAAHYERAKAPRIDRHWIIWQHNCKGHVNGIDAEVDFNVVNGSLFSLKGLCL